MGNMLVLIYLLLTSPVCAPLPSPADVPLVRPEPLPARLTDSVWFTDDGNLLLKKDTSLQPLLPYFFTKDTSPWMFRINLSRWDLARNSIEAFISPDGYLWIGGQTSQGIRLFKFSHNGRLVGMTSLGRSRVLGIHSVGDGRLLAIEPNRLSCFDSEGRLLWIHSFLFSDRMNVLSLYHPAKDLVLYSVRRGRLEWISWKDGKTLHRVTIGTRILRMDRLPDGSVILYSKDRKRVFLLKDGKLIKKWSAKGIIEGWTVHQKRPFVTLQMTLPGSEPVLATYDARTGQMKWCYTMPHPSTLMSEEMTRRGELLLLVRHNYLLAIDDGGHATWHSSRIAGGVTGIYTYPTQMYIVVTTTKLPYMLRMPPYSAAGPQANAQGKEKHQ